MRQLEAIALGAVIGTLASTAFVSLARELIGVDLNPANPDNAVNRAVTGTVRTLTGDQGETLGGWLYEKLNGTYDPNAAAATLQGVDQRGG